MYGGDGGGGQDQFRGYHNKRPQQQYQQQQSSSSQQPLTTTTEKPRLCHYEVLGVERGIGDEKELKKAYHRQSLIWHPDKNGHRREEAEERFKLISEAYQVLTNEREKQLYDLYGFDGPPNESVEQYSQGSFPSDIFFSRSGSQASSFFGSRGFPFGFENPHSDMFSSFGSPFGGFFGQPTASFGLGGQQRSQPPGFMSPFGHDPFSSFSGFPSFSMFPDFPGVDSFPGYPFQGHSGSQSSVSTSTTYVNGRATTYRRTTDADGNVTTEVIHH